MRETNIDQILATMTGGVEEEGEAAPFPMQPIRLRAWIVIDQYEAATCRWARRPYVDRQTKPLSAGRWQNCLPLLLLVSSPFLILFTCLTIFH